MLQTISVKAKAETDQNSVRATTSTIGRGNQDLRDIPQSVTVITEKLMEDRRVDTVKEALHYTAGISFQAAEGGEEDIRLRGFSLTASGDIFIDGVRDTAFYERDVFNFDRIEVLRGSASMLFGRGSTGGVVNQVSKTALPATVSEVSTTIGSGSYLRLTGDFNLKTSETSAFRLNAMTTNADNYGNAVDKYGIAPTFRWGIGTADEFSAGLFYLENRNGINYGIPWLRKDDSGPISEANPGGLLKVDPKNYYGAASDYNATSAAYGTLHYTHRFQDGGAWHTVLRSGGYDRDQRASTIRYCVRTTNAQTGVVTNPDCPTVGPTQATVSDATPLNRGTANKVQDLQASYLQTDYTKEFTWLGRANELLAGVDLSREEFNNFAMVLPAGVVLDKNTPRTTVGTPNDGTSVEEGLRTKVLTRNFVAKAIGVYAQDIIEVVEHWKLLGGLRWDRFDGDYVSPPTSRHAADRALALGFALEPALRRALAAERHAARTTLRTAPRSTPPASSTTTTPRARTRPRRRAATSRSAPSSTCSTARPRPGWRCSTPPSTTSATAIRPTASRSSSTSSRASAMRPASSSTWPAHRPRLGGVPLVRLHPGAEIDEAGPGGTLTGELPGQRPSMTPRHSGTLFTTYQLTPELRIGGGLNARSSQTPNRNPPGIVAPSWVTGDLLAEYAFNKQVTFKFNVINVANKLYADSLYTAPLHPRPAAHLLRDHDGALLNRRDILRRCCCMCPRS